MIEPEPDPTPDAAPLGRRRFLEMVSAALAVAGYSGDTWPSRDLVPNVMANPEDAAGAVSLYATAVTSAGYAEGVLVRHEAGIPMKVEGNPDHPASLGGTSPFGQAAILDLYDLTRAKAPMAVGRARSWTEFETAVIEATRPLAAGRGLRLLTGTLTSPTLKATLDAVAARYRNFRRVRWESAGPDQGLAGASLAFGSELEFVPHLDRAARMLAIDSDLFEFAPGRLAHAARFMGMRRHGGNRLYALESSPTLVGTMADHRLALPPADIEAMLRALAGRLGLTLAATPALPDRHRVWVDAVAADLAAHRGAALLHPGPSLPPHLHALAQAINVALSAPVNALEPFDSAPRGVDELTRLIDEMAGGEVAVLAILGGDPVYTAPADLDFAAALRRVPLSIYLGSHRDATARHCTWHVPLAHDFESWGDARAFDGTVTLLQPQIRPLFGGRSALAVAALLGGSLPGDDRATLESYWRSRHGGGRDFDEFWHEALRRGAVPGTVASPVVPRLKPDFAAALPPPMPKSDVITILFRPDPAAHDGRYLTNQWLQETPRPLTRISWENAALIAPATARRLGLQTGDRVSLRHRDGRQVVAPVLARPGHAENCVTLTLGYGRDIPANPGFEVSGFNAGPLRVRAALWQVPVTLTRLGSRHDFTMEQLHDRMEGRDLLRRVDAGEGHRRATEPPQPSLYDSYSYTGRAWGMAIDLTSCIGCAACVVACQAENNIPVVGQREVARGHIMQWLRIDRWDFGGGVAAEAAFQPVPCMHCEDAPCEVVCPVGATVHDHEGLNAMVYNRCIGTRFCSNNCPYKVRRFNFLSYAATEMRPAAARNGEVSVRSRGVMEKCSYCVQRIRTAEIVADRENRPLRDGEVVTACQAACPTEAIMFGDINDRNSAVRQRKADPLDYVLLRELNTRPRTSYAARVLNRNPAIVEGEEAG